MQVMYPERKCPAAGLVPCNNSVRERWISGINKMLSAKLLVTECERQEREMQTRDDLGITTKLENGKAYLEFALPER